MPIVVPAIAHPTKVGKYKVKPKTFPIGERFFAQLPCGFAELKADSSWSDMLSALEIRGVKLCGGPDEPAGHSLEATRAFEPGDEIIREAAVISLRFDDTYSPLEAAFVSHFKLTKMAPPYRLLARLLESETLSDPHSVVHAMAGNIAVAQSDWNKRFCTFFSEAVGGRVSPEGAIRLLAIIKTNAFGIYRVGESVADARLSSLGLGIYPLVALANHECDPSAVWSFDDDDRIVLRATRAHRAGDAITDGYLLPRQPPALRLHKLRESYQFECHCARCVSEEGEAEQRAAMAEELQSARARLEKQLLGPDAEAGGGDNVGEGEEEATTTEQMGVVKRCAKLLDKLTPRDDCHPDTAVIRSRLGAMWWRLFTRAQDAANQRRSKGQTSVDSTRANCVSQAIRQWQRAHAMLAISLGETHPLLESLLGSIQAAQLVGTTRALEALEVV